MTNKAEELIEAISRVVNKYVDYPDHSSNEDFNPYDWSGGNADDAFALGEDQGTGDLARWVAGLIYKYKNPDEITSA